MSIAESVSHSNRRVRRAGHHRGWAHRLMTPQALARDIVTAILSDHARPDAPRIRQASEFTDDLETLRMVDALLAVER